jgi:hypothetical protein
MFIAAVKLQHIITHTAKRNERELSVLLHVLRDTAISYAHRVSHRADIKNETCLSHKRVTVIILRKFLNG